MFPFPYNLDSISIDCYNLNSDKIGGTPMNKKSYHHGDLRKSLIEKGIEFINQYGEEKLSLRKIAERCGVSNAAPYAHFKDKDDFINAMQEYVLDSFMNSLLNYIDKCKDSAQILSELGVCYVMFFYHNPLYFDFLFSRKNIRIQLSSNNNIPPFELFKRTAEKSLKEAGLTKKDIRNKTIAMWSLVHGLSALSTMPNIDIDWESEVRNIINSIDISNKNKR